MSPRLRRMLRLALVLLVLPMFLAVAALLWAPLYRLAPHDPRPAAMLPPSPAVIAHRGWSGAAPENTLVALRKAAELGVAVELDVTLAASGEVVVIHDDTVDRTTDGEGEVEALTLEQLKALDAGSWYDPRFSGESVPTLAEVLSAIGGRVTIDIELKTTDQKTALAQGVVAAVQDAGLVDRVFVSSFDPYVLAAVRAADPSLRRGMLVSTYDKSDLAWYEKKVLQNLLLNGAVQPDLILVDREHLTDDWLATLKGYGYPVYVWTVNAPAEIERWLSAGVDGIITDHPDRALAAVKAHTAR